MKSKASSLICDSSRLLELRMMRMNSSRFASAIMFFFFQAEGGIRVLYVTGVQTCALPIWGTSPGHLAQADWSGHDGDDVPALECHPIAATGQVRAWAWVAGEGAGVGAIGHRCHRDPQGLRVAAFGRVGHEQELDAARGMDAALQGCGRVAGAGCLDVLERVTGHGSSPPKGPASRCIMAPARRGQVPFYSLPDRERDFKHLTCVRAALVCEEGRPPSGGSRWLSAGGPAGAAEGRRRDRCVDE